MGISLNTMIGLSSAGAACGLGATYFGWRRWRVEGRDDGRVIAICGVAATAIFSVSLIQSYRLSRIRFKAIHEALPLAEGATPPRYITSEGTVESLTELDVNITALKIEYANDELLRRLKVFDSLEEITIVSSTDVTDAGLASLADCMGLKCVKLRGVQVNGSGLYTLRHRLERLTIANCPKFSEMATVGQFTRVKKLTLAHLPKQDLSHLSKMEGLGELKLENLDVGQLEFFPECKSVRRVMLTDLPVLSDAALENLPADLEEILMVGRMGIKGPGLAHLGKMEKMSFIVFGKAPWLNDTVFSHLVLPKRLTSLHLYEIDNFTGSGLRVVKGHFNIRVLMFRRCSALQGEIFKHITYLPRLQRVYVGGSPKLTLSRGMEAATNGRFTIAF